MVVADRFLFTALARDTARGLDLTWVVNAYVPLFWPDMIFYFDLPPEVSSQRIMAKRSPATTRPGRMSRISPTPRKATGNLWAG